MFYSYKYLMYAILMVPAWALRTSRVLVSSHVMIKILYCGRMWVNVWLLKSLMLCAWNLITNSTDTVCRCKKYPSMELRGLFQYLVNQLKKGNGIELVLLQVFSFIQIICHFVTHLFEQCCDLKFHHWFRNLFNKWPMFSTRRTWLRNN